MATVNFLYRSTKDKAALNIRLLFRHNGEDIVLGAKTKFEVSKHYWGKQHPQKRPKDIDIINKQKDVNNELNKIRNHILKAFDNEDPANINKNWLNLQTEYYYNPPKKTEIPTNLIEYIDFYIKYREHEIKPTSIKKYNVIKRKLERFQVKRGKPILIKDINDSFKNEFVTYQKSEGYSQNTMQKELVYIKTFCKHARGLGLETHPQLDKLKLEKGKTEKIYLSFAELEKIETQTFDKDYLDNARDWLLISCYTGQRVSDFLRFTADMVRIENGKSLIEFTQKKTGKLMTVPLHGKVLEILKKRNGNFPRKISDQRYNDYIKEVCRIAGINNVIPGKKRISIAEEGKKPTKHDYRDISGKFQKWELITSHAGRRSFASNFYGQIPTSYLIYITGHSTEAMFLNYIGKSNKDLAMEISNYF